MTPLIKNIIIGAVVIVAVFVLYRFFMGGEQDAPLTATAPVVQTGAQDDLLSLLLELKAISLSDELFTDPSFASLQDFTVRLSPEPIGRRNPFAVGGVVEAPVEEASDEDAEQ